MARNTTYETLCPVHVVPDHFFCSQSSTIVVVYEHPLGEEENGVTLIFPGDMPGSAPRRIIPQRLGRRALLFDTPVYTFSNRGMLEVLPLLSLPSGEVELSPFRIGLKHPIRNMTELCLNLSTHDAVLPVLMALMVHSNPADKAQFQDPQIDMIMATLVGSKTPGTSTKIRDIVLPAKKWKEMTLESFARHFQCREMEKQAYMLNNQRLKSLKAKKKAGVIPKRNIPTYENLDPLSDCREPTVPESAPATPTFNRKAEKSVEETVQKLIQEAETLCHVVEDYHTSDPEKLTIQSGQRVYVVHRKADGWWYGVCGNKHGYFPATHVRQVRKLKPVETPTELELLNNKSDSLRPGGQLIKDLTELQKPLRLSYNSVYIPSESENSPFTPERMRRMHAVPLMYPPPNLHRLRKTSLSESIDTGMDRMQDQPSAQPFHPVMQSPKKTPLLPPGSSTYPPPPLATTKMAAQFQIHKDSSSDVSSGSEYDDIQTPPHDWRQKSTWPRGKSRFSADELDQEEEEEPPTHETEQLSESSQNRKRPVPLPRRKNFNEGDYQSEIHLQNKEGAVAKVGPPMPPKKPLKYSKSAPYPSSGAAAETLYSRPWETNLMFSHVYDVPEPVCESPPPIPPRNIPRAPGQHFEFGGDYHPAQLRKGVHAKHVNFVGPVIANDNSHDSGITTDADSRSHVSVHKR